MLIPFIINFLVKTGIYFLIMYLSGLLVLKKGVKVNYTRKINHFSLLAVPFLLGIILRQPPPPGGGTGNYIMQVIGLLSGLLFLVLFIGDYILDKGLIMTLAEAKAPHTWDNPILFSVGSILLFLILHFVA